MKSRNLTAYLFSSAGVAAMFLILVAVYLIAGVVKTRVDLTQDRIYTLSKGTREILKKLDTPVQIRFYATQSSGTMPVQLKTYAQRVEDLLNEYKKVGRGNLDIKKFDPTPDSDAEDSANLDGVQGQVANTGDKIYLGLAISMLDTKVALPFLSPEREKLLEYDISRAISRVMKPEKPVIGVMSALPVFGEMNPMMMQMGRASRQDPWVFLSELKNDFTVKQVEMTADKIDDDIKTLVVFYPRDITDKAEFALDQFVLRGGKLIAFLDSLSIADSRSNPMNPMQRNMSSGASLDKLLKAWGIEYDKGKVAADMAYQTRINQGGRPAANPAVLSLTQDALHTNDVVTSQIDSLLVPFSGAFSGTPAEGLKREILIKTTSNSQLVDKMMAEFSGEQLSKEFTPGGKELALAIRLTGKFKTAFSDGKPKDTAENKDEKKDGETKNTPAGPFLKESAGENTVILVGDADLLFDQVCARVENFFGQRIVVPMGGNLTFMQNMVEQMASDSSLISVRGRATMSRPFTVVKRMQAHAEERYRTKIKELEKTLADTQQKLNEMQTKKEGGQRFILSPEQQEAIKNFQKEEARAKKELKEVRKNLRQDIDSLENNLKWMNIAGMPLLVAGAGIVLAVIKKRKTAAK